MSGSQRFAGFVVLCGVGFLIWQLAFGPKENVVTFVLTEVELPGTTTLLRHEHVKRLDCIVLDSEGVPVASMFHSKPGAVATPAPVTLPEGDYLFKVKLTFVENGVQRTREYDRHATLKGGEVRIQI